MTARRTISGEASGNLTVEDVATLATALARVLHEGQGDLADIYSDDCLERIWRATRLACWMISMIRVVPETIRTRTRIWAAGVRASPLAALPADKLGVQTDRAGRLPVGPDCTLAAYPEVFAIGDMVSLNGLPGVAQPAMQEGKYVARLIRARLAGQALPGPFRYSDRGSMATIGHRLAVVESAGVRLTGTLAYLVWGFVHVMYLIGWGNRLGTIYSWASALYLSKNRSHRLISFETAGYEIAGQRTLSRTVQPVMEKDMRKSAEREG